MQAMVSLEIPGAQIHVRAMSNGHHRLQMLMAAIANPKWVL